MILSGSKYSPPERIPHLVLLAGVMLAGCQRLPLAPTAPIQRAETMPIVLNFGGLRLMTCLIAAGDAVQTVRDIEPSKTLWAVRARGKGWDALFTDGTHQTAIYD